MSAALIFSAVAADAQSFNAHARLVTTWQAKDLTGNSAAAERLVALEEMDEVHDRPGDNCTQFIGPITVEGIQFTPTGGTLETFRFTDKNGNQWSVPTNIGRLSNVDRQHANSFIRVGKRYFVHVQVCGSGGNASLVSMYDGAVNFGPVR
ncbi:hypothetical protein A8D61_13820 [Burkholderia cenocepacia]|nr:hypothetical protein A8D61_13820 [Burkholderia cenocepacia]ONJ19258.1 hypothetical protein A8D82_09870 [Burkholderia cenocepacia]ONN78692.1 hypothetical protein A8D62_35580 [Burkholderia cenocepacia]ONN92702.1 hypothetical protein A8D64_07320 [Burkholderia cenocepacia]ONN99969.1 hypothetical protein A8D67_30910 [Burkholderia cenocepacia]